MDCALRFARQDAEPLPETVESATNVLTSLLKGLADLAIWIVVVLGPFLIPVALIVWLVIWFRRRRPRPEKEARPAPESRDEEPAK